MIEKILNEISRLKKELKGYSTSEALDYIEAYINTLPEEFTDEANCTTKNEDLDEYYKKEFLPKEWFAKPGQRTISEFNKFTAIHFAEWQRKKDQQTIELAEGHAMLAGMDKMREEIMKDAVEGLVGGHTDIPAFINLEIEHKPNVKVGDKVKIIIIKEEEL